MASPAMRNPPRVHNGQVLTSVMATRLAAASTKEAKGRPFRSLSPTLRPFLLHGVGLNNGGCVCAWSFDDTGHDECLALSDDGLFGCNDTH
jgi:hypothetical protein